MITSNKYMLKTLKDISQKIIYNDKFNKINHNIKRQST